MKGEKLKTIEYIPIKNFKEKIRLTKENIGKCKLEIMGNFVYIEKVKYE